MYNKDTLGAAATQNLHARNLVNFMIIIFQISKPRY